VFCIYFEFIPIPTSVPILTLYAQFLGRSFKSVDFIRNCISAIKWLHLYLDLEYSQFESFHFKLVLKGLSRLNSHCPNQAQPMTPYMLCDMFNHFNMSTAGNRHKQNSWFCKEIREDNFRFWWKRVHEDASQVMYMSKIEIFFFTARVLQNQRMLCCGECFHD
jgi:hypothetical protein